MKGSKFDMDYNEWLHQVDVGEGDSVWEGVQDELDFMETWDNISTQLDVVMPPQGNGLAIKHLKPMVAAAALILLMLLPVKDITDHAVQPVIVSKQPAEVSKTELLIPDETIPVKVNKKETAGTHVALVDLPSEKPLDKNSSSIVLENSRKALVESENVKDAPEIKATDLKRVEPGLIQNKNVENAAVIEKEILIHRIQPLSFDYNDLLVGYHPASSDLMKKRSSPLADPDNTSGFSIRVAEFGLVYAYKNTWLLNYETRNGLDPEKLGNTLPTFHQDIGATTTLEFNSRYRVGMEFLFKSESGQNYQQYINASFVDKNINLNYLKFQTFYYLDSKRIPGNAIVGAYIARLATAEEQLANTKFSIGQNYTRLDYGLLAGYQFNIAMGNRLMIKPGLRVNYNLNNIFKGDDIMPSRFKKTNNLSASFNVSITYGFHK
ncbi:MAG: hypothetical protein RBR28_06765 [Lentimicrobium sp.]|jgi:hypothetical protein|nr:hypothetical protein [Lentimicrobium sp.]